MKNQQSNIVAIDINAVKSRILEIRNQQVLLDRDVAALYGVETKRVNEAVRNNPDKFPLGYMFQLNTDELESLRSKFSSANLSSKSRVAPKAFTEKGLYMLATVLKSHRAVEATFAIIETYAEVRAMKHELLALHTEKDAQKRNSMMRHFGEVLSVLDEVRANLDAEDLGYLAAHSPNPYERAFYRRQLTLRGGMVE